MAELYMKHIVNAAGSRQFIYIEYVDTSHKEIGIDTNYGILS
jgi:hypothetical protein